MVNQPRKIELTQERLKEVFDYIVDTGELRWRVSRDSGFRKGAIKAGTLSGCVCKSTGYLIIDYNKRKYKAHRLVWIYVNGVIPDGLLIDHVDGDKTNNRVSNLRLCTPQDNVRNTGIRKDNTSGYKGVSWSVQKQRWVAQTSVNGKKQHLGYYLTEEKAVSAYEKFCLETHGEFYRDTTQLCNTQP